MSATDPENADEKGQRVSKGIGLVSRIFGDPADDDS